VIATAHFMLVLDDSVANVALPSIKNDLDGEPAMGSSTRTSSRSAVLLLFGGRLGDLLGRRRVLQVGMSIFTVAVLIATSRAAGAALIGARGLQCIGDALTAPIGLALIHDDVPGGHAIAVNRDVFVERRDGSIRVPALATGSCRPSSAHELPRVTLE